MIYAVLMRPMNRIRGFYTEEKLAQEHADFINKYSMEMTHKGPVSAEVLTILQEHDKEKAAQS